MDRRRHPLRRGRRLLCAAGVALAFGTLIAGVQAQIPTNGVVHACIRMDRDNEEGRLVRLVGAAEQCRRNEVRVQWNVIGPPGPQGPAGPKGDKGDPGTPGATGATGPAGATGAKGDTGAIGPQGAKGDTGATGPQGAKGDTGATGANGVNGTNGAPGAKGDTGSAGPAGPAGPQGPPGADARNAPSGGISGQLESCDGSSLAGYLVYVPGRAFSVFTGADGRFEIDLMPAGSYSLSIEHNGSLAGTVTGVPVGTTVDALTQLVHVGGACTTACSVNNGNCDPLTTCTAGGSGVVCGACPAGYTGTGQSGCVPIQGTACTSAADCPGIDGACQQRTCTAGVCGVAFAVTGTMIASQTAGDCRNNVCDGAGGIISIANDADVAATGNQCQVGRCTNGVPSSTPAAAGTACNQGGGTVCDGGGSCVQCASAAQCGVPNAVASCTAGVCGVAACNAGFANCNNNPADGCEVNVNNSLSNCGACGRACIVPVNGSAFCTNGSCGIVCNAGFTNVGGQCVAKLPSGEVCQTGNQCLSSNCGANNRCQ